MQSHHKPHGPYEEYFKRPLDFICSLGGILVFWWLYAIVAVLVRIKLGSPILFMQPRPGKDEKIFNLYKFRTMTDERDENGGLLPDDKRLTKFGQFLRSTSLDELPEIFNILKGDMSIIGPRPLLVRYLPRYNKQQHRRHEVKPGLTGWAQVNGRNAISWEQKFEYDVWYIDHVNLGLDIKIFLMTLKKALVKHEGISSATSATMEEFKGSSPINEEGIE